MRMLLIIAVSLAGVALAVSAQTQTVLAWGAIAVDDEPGLDPDSVGYGIISGYAIEVEAINDAIDACKDEGNDDCRIVLVFRKCGAYAASKYNYGVGTAPTLREAEHDALASCGERVCRVIASDCD
jgi:Domain of unknown function (DUF4189)